MSLASYLIAIVAISIVTVVVEVVLPEGNMASFIRRIVALIVVFVIISPIPSILKKQNINLSFGSENSIIDENLLNIIAKQKSESLQDAIKAALKVSELETEVFAPPDYSKTEFSITFVSIKILAGSMDIPSIKRVVKKYVKIDDSKIFVS